ncbi:hypothetical protein PGTUg99_004755 [Puccinia graminis f. sp. tritici]|uniref:Uncharacterized protein n=1 Tax=Puccinia graminis f. sp. tritici TaxID=56615 RepID=A0A5B0N9X2_PUCGR|nr:hypothetical protein PGTUg99_004755 [Puccinia graminis f. sp. tritici]
MGEGPVLSGIARVVDASGSAGLLPDITRAGVPIPIIRQTWVPQFVINSLT